MTQKLPVLVLVCLCFATADVKSEDKVVFIGKEPDHPYGSHMYMHTGKVLSKCLHRNGINTVLSDGWPTDARVLDDVSAIVIYASPAAELLLDAPHRDQVDALINKGVGLVTIHWASSVRKENFERIGPLWLSYLGGTWISNVGLDTGTSTLQQLRAEHPICRGWKEFELHDEYYLNPTITDEATPLLQATSKGSPVVVGWAFERPDGGRSFATTLGHFYRNFQRDEFRRVIVNAILWSARAEIPPNGAAVDVSEEVLKLPPEAGN